MILKTNLEYDTTIIFEAFLWWMKPSETFLTTKYRNYQLTELLYFSVFDIPVLVNNIVFEVLFFSIWYSSTCKQYCFRSAISQFCFVFSAFLKLPIFIQNFIKCYCINLLFCIKVNLQYAAKINMRALHQAVEGRQRLLTQEPIVVLDIIMHYAATKQ